MTINNNNILRISPIWLVDSGDEQINTLHVRAGSITTQTQTDIRDDIEEWLSNLYGNVVGEMYNGVIHDRTEIFNETTSNPELPLGVDTSLNGTNPGEVLPLQVAALVFGRTGVNRRIARKFLPSFCENSLSGGVWGTSTMNALTLFAGDFDDEYTATNNTTIFPCVYSLIAGPAYIIQGVASNVPAIQRRRRLGRGS